MSWLCGQCVHTFSIKMSKQQLAVVNKPVPDSPDLGGAGENKAKERDKLCLSLKVSASRNWHTQTLLTPWRRTSSTATFHTLMSWQDATVDLYEPTIFLQLNREGSYSMPREHDGKTLHPLHRIICLVIH